MDRRHTRFLQANINHCAGAQDLLLQSMAEWLIDIAVVWEPYLVPENPRWITDLDESVVILAGGITNPIPTILERGSGYVVAK